MTREKRMHHARHFFALSRTLLLKLRFNADYESSTEWIRRESPHGGLFRFHHFLLPNSRQAFDESCTLNTWPAYIHQHHESPECAYDVQ
mmetsp:Transcript_4351/g.16401  ORF Transcript_4351/g.16401 Transcript_4351/m.16401 type:complete len:89 (+) Transcript_4351:2553-2819(+)